MSPGMAIGERTERGPFVPLVIAGSVTLGGAWSVSSIVAATRGEPNATEWLYVPLAGPWITLGARNEIVCTQNGQQRPSQTSISDQLTFEDGGSCAEVAAAENRQAIAGLIVDGVIQAGGLAMLIAGLIVQRERVVPIHAVAPLLVDGGAGLQVLGSF
jgi:hypothetical protein